MKRKLGTAFKQDGLSLIEILVTIVILAIGLLGLAGLQMTGVRNNHTAYQRTQASSLAYEIMDRIRANPTGASANNYLINLTTSIPSAPEIPDNNCYDAACTPAQLASADLSQWYTEVQDRLPGGAARIMLTTTTPTNLYEVQVFWNSNKKPDLDELSYPLACDSSGITCASISFTP
ncbi:type IV pilus modification protein PilV [Pseudomonadota bacterium]